MAGFYIKLFSLDGISTTDLGIFQFYLDLVVNLQLSHRLLCCSSICKDIKTLYCACLVVFFLLILKLIPEPVIVHLE